MARDFTTRSRPWIGFPALGVERRRMQGSPLLLALVALMLWHCSPPPTVFPEGRRLLEGERPAPPPRPDSLSAELSLTFHEGGGRNTVSATLSALPYDKYKLDFFGLFGVLLAGFYFEDSSWTLAIYEDGVFMRREGNHIALPQLGVEPLSVHLFFSYLWGHFLPIGEWEDGVDYSPPTPTSISGAPIVRVEYGGEEWRVEWNARTGTVAAYVQETRNFRMEFENYRTLRGRPIPRRASLWREGKKVLDIEVKDVRYNPKWKRTPFFLKIPDSFREVELREPGP